MRNDSWQYKESSRRSKRNHADYRRNYSPFSYRLFVGTMWAMTGVGILGMIVAIANIIRTM